MKAIVALLFLSALALYAQAEMEYHPHAILNYLEREDHEMVRKVRGILKLQDPGPSFKPSFEPSFKPSFKPSFEPSFKPLVPLPIVSSCVFNKIDIYFLLAFLLPVDQCVR